MACDENFYLEYLNPSRSPSCFLQEKIPQVLQDWGPPWEHRIQVGGVRVIMTPLGILQGPLGRGSG